MKEQWKRSKEKFYEAFVCFAAAEGSETVDERVCGWRGDGIVKRNWPDIDVELEVSGSLVSCFGKEKEEEDEAGTHEDREKVEGPLPS
jgi:hypothetical protein